MSEPIHAVEADNARRELLKLLQESREECVNKRRLAKLNNVISCVRACDAKSSQTTAFWFAFIRLSLKLVQQSVTKKHRSPTVNAYARWTCALVPILTKK